MGDGVTAAALRQHVPLRSSPTKEDPEVVLNPMDGPNSSHYFFNNVRERDRSDECLDDWDVSAMQCWGVISTVSGQFDSNGVSDPFFSILTMENCHV